MKKKLTAMLLILSMVCTFLPVSAMAAEATPEAAIGDVQYNTLQEAIDAAKDGETVTLLKDITVSNTYSGDSRYSIGIEDKTITIDGQNQFILDVSKTQRGIYVKGSDSDTDVKNVTFQNIIIENKTALGRCIDTRGGHMSLVFNSVTLKSTVGGNTQPLTVGGNHMQNMSITINDSTIEAGDAGYGIITFNPVDLTINHSNITGYAALYMKQPNQSAGSAGSKVDVINDSVLTGNNPHPAGTSSSFATIAVDDPRIVINVDNSKVVSNATGGEEQYAFSFMPKAVEGSKVSITGNSSVELKGKLAFFKDVIADTTITGGTFTKDGAPLDVSEYLDANLTQNSEGNIVPMDVADAAAKVGNDYYKSLIAAVKAVNNGETVTLLKDTNDNVTIPQGKNLTLDLNGKTLSNDSMYSLVVDGGKLTVTDSTAGQPVVGDDNNTVTYLGSGMIKNTFNNNGEAKAIQVQNGGVLNLQGGTVYCVKGSGIFAIGDKKGNTAVASTIHMTGGYVEAQEYGIGVIGKGATLTMDGGVVKARDNAAVGGNGSNTENNRCGGTTITINGGTLIGNIQSAGYVACGIYHPQEGTLTVNGGNIYVHNGAGILTRGGAATVNNVNIVTTGKVEGKIGDSEIKVPPSAVVVDEKADYPGDGLDTNIKGGNFVSAEGVSNVTLVGQTNDKLTVSGGEFSAPVPKDNLDDALKIEVKDPQDKDTPYSYYPSVEEALKNEQGDQLEIKDVTVTDQAQTCIVTLEDGSAESKVTLNKDSVFKLPSLEREGYTFIGWKDANGNVYQAGKEVTVTEDIIFTAVWESNSTGGGVVTRYDITLADTDNGTITATHKRASKNSTVTITATPAEGYAVDAVTVTEKDGDKVNVTKKDDNKYTFKMPASDVTVKATFKATQTEPEQPSGLPFTDVAKDAWYFPAVEYVFNNGLMNGTTATTFAPNVNLNRAMMAAVLYNMEGQPACDKSGLFSDVADGKWYTDAVNWAASNNIVSGIPDGTYAPDQALTREQMASVLYRYAEYKGIDVSARADLSTFTDGTTVSPWAQDVVQWAVAEKLMSGNGNELQPKGTATRAQVATVLMNYSENVAK